MIADRSNNDRHPELPPFFHDPPDNNYDDKGKVFDKKTYNWKSDADGRGGWYDDYVPTTGKHARFADEVSTRDRDDKYYRPSNESRDCDSNDSDCDRSSNPSGSNERLKRLRGIQALLAVKTYSLANSSKSGKTD